MLKVNFGYGRRFAVCGLVLFVSVGAAMLEGCGGMGLAPTQDATANVVFGGRAHGGQQPLTQSHVALFATTSAGYTGTLTPLTSTTTDNNGNFLFTGSYTCPATQQAYVVIAGGNPGLAVGTDNSAVFLMAAIGPCTSISSGTFVVVNEVTTVAAAYALSGFVPAGGAGLTEAAVAAGTAMPGVTTSSTNVQGITDGFANAANIVNIQTGLAYTATPAAGGAVPQATIHALADILQPCVNSIGAASASCVSLFAAATPPAGTGIAAPVNAFQAALDIAQYPGNNVSALFGLINPQAAFATSLSAAPNDWTVGITYTNSTLSGALALAVDANDNVWVGGSVNADIMEFSPQGAMLSPAPSGTAPGSAAGPQGGWAPSIYQNPAGAGTGDNFRNIAFDLSGNAWFSDGTASGSNKGVYEYTPAGTATAPVTGTLTERSYAAVNTDTNNYTVAADQFGNIWTSSYKKSTCGGTTTKVCNVVEMVPPSYTAYNTFSSFMSSSPDVNGSRGLAVDVNTGNIWTTDIGSSTVTLFPATLVNGAVATASSAARAITLGSGTDASYGVSIDVASNAWVLMTTSGGLYELSKSGVVAGAEIVGGGLVAPSNLVIDGNGNLFIANAGVTAATTSVVEYSPGFKSNAGAFLSPNLGFSPGATYVPANGSTPATLSGGTLYQGTYVAVDRSGALWALSGGTGTSPSLSNLVQILGVAAPVNPVLAAGKYGVKP